MLKDIFINGVKLRVKHIHVSDTRPTIVFLHDSLGCIELWRDFPEKLGIATNMNVLVYDRQGYGQSSPFTEGDRQLDYLEKEAAVLNILLEKCAIERAILLGHSDGGSIALIAAAEYPEKIKAIITEGAHIFVEDITLNGVRAAVEMYHTTNLKERLYKYHGENTEGVFLKWTKTWLREDFNVWNIEGFLPHIHCPALIIQGENDEFGTLKQVEGIINQVSGKAEKWIIPNVGHTPHKEIPTEIIERTKDFLNGVF